MVKKSPYQLTIKKLKDLANKKRDKYCLAVSKMKKDELIKYVYGRSKKIKQTVNELRKLATEKKKKECLSIQKMSKKELINYIYGYDVPEPKKKETVKDKTVKKDKTVNKDKTVKKEKMVKEKVYKELCEELANIKYNETEILKKRDEIYKKLKRKVKGKLTSGSFNLKISNELLTEMFHLYDKYFFKNKIAKISEENNCNWTICWNQSCIGSAAGLCGHLVEEECILIKIELNREVFKKSLRLLLEKKDQVLNNSGIRCDNLLSCMQITFEHEMIHGIMKCECPKYLIGIAKEQTGNWKGKSGTVKSGHGKTFMSIVNNLFGHTDWKHTLTWSRDEMESYENKIKKGEQMKEKLKVGDLIKIMKKSGEEVILRVLKKNPKKVRAAELKGPRAALYTWNVPYTLIIEIVNSKGSKK